MKEAFNAEKFAENFKKLDYVKVPEIYWEYTTPQVSSTQKIQIDPTSNLVERRFLSFFYFHCRF